MSLLRHDSSIYWRLNCFFNSLSRLTTRNIFPSMALGDSPHKGSVIVSFDLKYSANQLFVQQLIQANNKQSSLHIAGLFGQESTIERWKGLSALISNFRKLDCLFNSLLRQTTKTTSKLCTVCLWWGFISDQSSPLTEWYRDLIYGNLTVC